MDSGSWGGALETVAACGGAGAFIDFWIGRTGQQRVKGWLETLWIKLSYVRWGNFGREEALFAVQAMDWLCGRQLFSVRRLKVTCNAAGIAILYAYVSSLFNKESGLAMMAFSPSKALETYLINLALFAISISITRAAASITARLLFDRPAFNFIGFVALATFQYLLLCNWPTIVNIIEEASWWYFFYSFSFIGTFIHMFDIDSISITPDHVFSRVRENFFSGNIEGRLNDPLMLLPNLGRLLLSLIFVGSYALQPLQRPVMTLLARIIESDKPVFTLLFGGAAAITKATQEIIKNF